MFDFKPNEIQEIKNFLNEHYSKDQTMEILIAVMSVHYRSKEQMLSYLESCKESFEK